MVALEEQSAWNKQLPIKSNFSQAFVEFTDRLYTSPSLPQGDSWDSGVTLRHSPNSSPPASHSRGAEAEA